ncbi:MAG: thiaminase II [Pirellulales bacterium]|nr:thiaminase II [Pirellulales bacterium]
MLHETLWQENADITQRCLKHPFVQGLADGTLDRNAFRKYVAQDAFFLRAFLRAYALATAKSDDWSQARVFHDLMSGVLEELKLHESYATKLGIELENVRPYAATSAYTDFLLRVTRHNSLAEIIAAMVPCLRVYTYLGTELSAFLRLEHPYEDWIRTYSSDKFRELCSRLEALLDEVASDSPTVRHAYRYAMQCELDFFSAPLENAP